MASLSGKVVVITGAASGIGRATALLFADAGARLHLVDIDESGLAAVLAEVEARGATGTTHVANCTDPEALEALAAEVFAEPEGRVDVLHNNAGACCGGSIEQLSLEDWRWTMELNFYGVLHGVRAFLPGMLEQGGGGHIVNTGSMAGLVGLPMVGPYCASKFAVVGLSEALDAELAVRGIRVTAICPGGTKTNVLRNARLELPNGLEGSLIPGLDRWGADPQRVARKIVRAIQRRQSFVATGIDMLPLWWLKRFSTRLYQAVSRILSAYAMRRAS